MKLKKSGKPKSVISDRIADALTVKSRADIEDDIVFDTKPKTVSRGDLDSESDEEAAISDFRRRNANLLSDLSKKYEGEVVSRKDLNEKSLESDYSSIESDNETSDSKHAENPSSGSEVDDDDDDKPESKTAKDIFSLVKSQIQGSDDDDENSDDDESDDYSITKLQKQGSDDDEEGYDISEMQEPLKESFEHIKKQNISEEVKKGICVRNQLLLWEGLLEMRIHLQRCMNTSNRMPMPECYDQIKKEDQDEFITQSNVTKTNLTNILDKLLLLQNTMLKSFPDTKTLLSNTSLTKQKEDQKAKPNDDDDEEIPSDTDEEIPSDTETEELETTPNIKQKTTQKKRKLQDYEKDLSTTHKAFKPFRDATIKKWNDKTRIASAASLKNAPTNTILQQITYILSDHDKLIHRTQLKRSDYDIIGYTKPITEVSGDDVKKARKDDDEYIPEIFDDTDFYHQLLRELIECKSSDISDPVQLSRQWIALQQMRSKMKRKVDTKATKGRRIKYVVHNKLVNFMAPEKNLTWTEESKTELYNSLFGKLFENNNGMDVNNSFIMK